MTLVIMKSESIERVDNTLMSAFDEANRREQLDDERLCAVRLVKNRLNEAENRMLFLENAGEAATVVENGANALNENVNVVFRRLACAAVAGSRRNAVER